MDFGKAGWLTALLDEAVAAHAHAPAADADGGLPRGRARARAHLRRTLRASGLLYGAPATGLAPADGLEPAAPGRGAPQAPELQLFLAVVRTFARLALDVAQLTGAPPASRREQLLVLFAVFTGRLDDAETLALHMAARPGEPLPRRLAQRVEGALEERAQSLAGDPAYGLVLHNGALYADAQLFGRHAIAYFARGGLERAAAERRALFAARQKALLVEVLVALACAERPPGVPARRAMLRQVEDLRLPDPVAAELRARVRGLFERRRPAAELVRRVRSRDLRHFLLEQTLLASLVDGRQSRGERAFIEELGRALGVDPEALGRLEQDVAEFYARNRSVVDVFTVSEGAGRLGEELVSGVQATLQKNFTRLMQEVRETGELSVLLAKAARGHALDAGERRRMRAQLIDVAKAIPALAIFAAPGGMLLLVALAKVLPFSLLPSSFQEAPEDGPLAPGEGEEPSA